jgi:hypothetical protein
MAGTYDVTIDARFGETNVTAEPIPVEVGRLNLEFEKLDLDEKTLQAIAKTTGGRYVPLATADHLIDQLNRQQKKQTEYVEQKLYWPPGFWMVFVGTLTVEWVLRRRYQLR